MKTGIIENCVDAGCNWKCCDFGSDGHIVMMPNEYEGAEGKGHLKIIDNDYMNGKKVKCIAVNKKNCDGGHKPIQCKLFPLWIRGDGKIERSTRCPLRNDQIENHSEDAIKLMIRYDIPQDFLDNAELNSYVEKKNVINRTFGLELEFGNVNKKQVSLPEGYQWSPEERSIVNSDAKKSTPSGDYGGELNTRPLKMCDEDLSEVKGIINECFDAGGEIMWNTGFDGHIYIGDLDLEQLKRIFALGFYVSPTLNKIFRLGGWFNVDHLVPTPTFKFNEMVQNAKNIGALKNIFSNSSNRGHYRFQINIMAYFTTKTLEFRLFNSSKNFDETFETIRFMYRFLDYALTKTYDDFKAIQSEQDFISAFGVTKKFPDKENPLIFAECHKETTRSISRAFAPSRKIMSAIIADTSEKVSIINPFYYQAELALYKTKQLRIYNNSELNHIIYLVCMGELVITYSNRFEVLNEYKDGHCPTELSLFFIFARVQKYDINMDYGLREYTAHIDKIDESIIKMKENSERMIEMMRGSDYQQGTIRDALKDGGEIVYQQEANSKGNSACTSLRKHSGYDLEFEKKETRYENIDKKIQQGSKLLVVSKNDFLPYNKIARDLDVTLYSSQKSYLGVRQVIKDSVKTCIMIPENDFVINIDTDIQINEVKPTFFSILQKMFVKKVTKFKQPKLCYTITSGEMTLGAFGFEYSKGDYSLYLLSDFCTNNDIQLMSKFILLIIRTKEVQRILERKRLERIKNAFTKVYTSMPVSMKYRGAFKKKERTKNHLVYAFDFGSIGTIEDAKRDYMKRCRNAKKQKNLTKG